VSGPRPRLVIESVRPLEMPILAALVEEFNDLGFDVERQPPVEHRAAGVIQFITLQLVDGLRDVALDEVIRRFVAWARDSVRPAIRQNGIAEVTAPIYGPDGEVLVEVTVRAEPEDDDGIIVVRYDR